jgi:hypothetical protein
MCRARVGSVEIVQNIIIGHSDKQEPISASEGNGIYFSLIKGVSRRQEALFARPYGRWSGQGGFHTFCKNGFFDLILDLMKTAAHHAAGINNAQTLMRHSGGGAHNLKPVTKYYLMKSLIRRGGLITISNLVRQPEAIKKRTNISAELSLSTILLGEIAPYSSASQYPRS